jgi:hypothetical protein
MALAGKLAGIVSSVLVFVMLMMAGCQGQRAEAPAAKPEPARSVPVRASEEVSSGKSQVSSGKEQASSLPTSNLQLETSGETPDGVTTNEAAPEVKQEKTEAGKPEPSGPAVELTLKFVPGQTTTYRITTEYQRSVEWKGSPSAKPAVLTDGRTGNRIELTFEQRVQQVQDDGNAVVEITIRGLKYVGEEVNKVVLDFDSAGQGDSSHPLAALVGKSYQVKMSPQGQVLEISNVEPVRQAVQGGLPGHNVALRLLSEEEIRNRHEIVAFSALKDRFVRPGQKWSSIRTFSFADMGAKTYERVYTLRSVVSGQLSVPSSQLSAANGQLPTVNSEGRAAVVEMKAIPSAAMAEELHQRQAANPFARMSDNSDSYEGRLVLDLDSGQVREYAEQMQNEWIIADPAAMQAGQPAAIKMTARRLHRLEQVR